MPAPTARCEIGHSWLSIPSVHAMAKSRASGAVKSKCMSTFAILNAMFLPRHVRRSCTCYTCGNFQVLQKKKSDENTAQCQRFEADHAVKLRTPHMHHPLSPCSHTSRRTNCTSASPKLDQMRYGDDLLSTNICVKNATSMPVQQDFITARNSTMANSKMPRVEIRAQISAKHFV